MKVLLFKPSLATETNLIEQKNVKNRLNQS